MQSDSSVALQLSPPLPRLALSIRQPWAWAITTLGKDIENRSWRTKYCGPVLIHAGKGVKGSDCDDFLATIEADAELRARLEAAGGLNVEALRAQTGGIVGVVDIADCVTASPSPWFFGPHGFALRNAKPLPFRACLGALGFFDPRTVGQPVKAPAKAIPSPAADLFD